MGLEGDEYRRLAGLSLLPNVRSRLLELAEEADRAEAAAKSTEAPAATTEPAAASAAGKPTAAAGFTKITSYAWDQDATKVKLHLTLPGVQQLPPEAIQVRGSSHLHPSTIVLSNLLLSSVSSLLTKWRSTGSPL